MSVILTHGKDGGVAELTGRKRKELQKTELRRMGLKYHERADGWPVVLASEIDKSEPKVHEPDFSSLG